MMTARYARLSDTTVRRHWEAARKVNINGQTVTLDPDGPLAEAAWAKQRVGRATQALPNGYRRPGPAPGHGGRPRTRRHDVQESPS
jgi:hypothetical protein